MKDTVQLLPEFGQGHSQPIGPTNFIAYLLQ